MPIRKFRSIEEMSDEHWYQPGDPSLYRAIRRIWALGHRTIQHHFPPGIYKNRTLEDMNARQKQWDDANFEGYHRRLQREKDLRRESD